MSLISYFYLARRNRSLACQKRRFLRKRYRTSLIFLVTELPELGSLTRRQIASLAGLAPIARDSGTFKGKRMTGGGRGDVRAKLFMPTLVAIQHKPAIREFYQRLLKAGKTKMTAVTACMRKMLTILNVMVAKKEYWKSELYA